jgi:hypothetical protein
MFAKSLARISGISLLCLAACAGASAQYGGGGTGMGGTGTGTGTTPNYTNNGYGNGKAIGIGVGAAAAVGVTAALLVHHHHVVAARNQASLVGCTQSLMSGITLKNENDNQTYTLLSKGNALQAGERVELKGVVTSDASGSPAFRVQSVANNFGACGTATAAKAKATEEKTELAQAAK